ncbi:MAG: hypothetical protein J6T15_03445 [Bacilli bacterium]|nr:hypothetical protein [Bacilli bacterium]
MNKQDIINRLKEFPYSKDEYWVITGSAMVLYGIREMTHDIDMGCTSLMADQLDKDGYVSTLTESGNRKFFIEDDIEIFENWKYGSVERIDDIPVLSLVGLIEMKKSLGRDKDYRDISLIKEFMEKPNK